MHLSKILAIIGSGFVASILGRALPDPLATSRLVTRGSTCAAASGSVSSSTQLVSSSTQTICGLLDLDCWLGTAVAVVDGVVFDVLAIVKQILVLLEAGLAFDVWLAEAFEYSGSLDYTSVGAIVTAGNGLLKTSHQTYFGATATQFQSFCDDLNTNYYVAKQSCSQTQFTALTTTYSVNPATPCS